VDSATPIAKGPRRTDYSFDAVQRVLLGVRAAHALADMGPSGPSHCVADHMSYNHESNMSAARTQRASKKANQKQSEKSERRAEEVGPPSCFSNFPQTAASFTSAHELLVDLSVLVDCGHANTTANRVGGGSGVGAQLAAAQEQPEEYENVSNTKVSTEQGAKSCVPQVVPQQHPVGEGPTNPIFGQKVVRVPTVLDALLGTILRDVYEHDLVGITWEEHVATVNRRIERLQLLNVLLPESQS